MRNADFYLIEQPRFREQPLRLVCELARRALGAHLPTLILTRSQAQAEALDELLWAFDDEAFVPHQIAGDDDDRITPVLIVPPEVRAEPRPLVINLRDQCVPFDVESIKEVVAAEATEREGSRLRWREYQQRGYALRKFDM